MHSYIREILSETFGSSTAESTLILYGGSVKPGNAADLLNQNDIDGALVGGASLDAESFAGIINAAERIT
jgi:triosephosphate isomerase